MVLVTWLIVSSLVTGTAARQAHPDFTGDWVLLEPADAPAEVPGEISITENRQAPGRGLTVRRQWLTEERTSIYYVGVIGGTVSGIDASEPSGQSKAPSARTFVAALWQGGTLVLEEGWHQGIIDGRDIWRERREEWSLDPSGALLIEVTSRGPSNDVRRASVRYRRK